MPVMKDSTAVAGRPLGRGRARGRGRGATPTPGPAITEVITEDLTSKLSTVNIGSSTASSAPGMHLVDFSKCSAPLVLLFF